MTSCYIPQIFLWFAVQNQFCIRQRVVVNKIIQFRPLCAAALFKPSYPRLQLKGNGHVKQKRQWTVCLPVDIPTGWEPRTNKSPTGAFVAPPAVGPYELRLLTFPQPLGGALKNQNAAPTTPPCFCRRQRSSSLLFKSSYPRLLLKGNGHIKQKRQ